jgi:hypothetical protein
MRKPHGTTCILARHVGALTAAAGFTVTTTASAGAHFPFAADGVNDINDVTAEDSATVVNERTVLVDPRTHRVIQIVE